MAESQRSMSFLRKSLCVLSLNTLCHTSPSFFCLFPLTWLQFHRILLQMFLALFLILVVVRHTKAVVSPARPTDTWTLPTTLSPQHERRLQVHLILPNLVFVHSLQLIHPVGTTRVAGALNYPMEGKIRVSWGSSFILQYTEPHNNQRDFGGIYGRGHIPLIISLCKVFSQKCTSITVLLHS